MTNTQYPSAKVVLRDPSNHQILLLKRTIDGEVGFEPAGGKVDADFTTRISESFEECVIREIKEELNLKVRITHYLGSYYYFWSLRNNAISHCVLFAGDIMEGVVKSVQQDGCGELDYAWISPNDIKFNKIPIRDYHVGLRALLLKAVNLPVEA